MRHRLPALAFLPLLSPTVTVTEKWIRKDDRKRAEKLLNPNPLSRLPLGARELLMPPFPEPSGGSAAACVVIIISL